MFYGSQMLNDWGDASGAINVFGVSASQSAWVNEMLVKPPPTMGL